MQCLAVNLKIGDGEHVELKDREKLALGMIVQLLNIHNQAKRHLAKSMPLGFEISPSLR